MVPSAVSIEADGITIREIQALYEHVTMVQRKIENRKQAKLKNNHYDDNNLV